MKNINIKLTLAACLFMVFAACDEFLEEPLSKTSSLIISTTDHLESLLNNYNDFISEANNTYVVSTDDFGLSKDVYDEGPNNFKYARVIATLWDTEFLQKEADQYWSSEWKKIFIANTVITNVDNVSGDEATKKNLEAEARFIRLYSYFNMVNTYCLPYASGNMAEMGLPLKQTTSFEESAKRATLQETWDFMDEDLAKALELSRNLEVKAGKNRVWRASNEAVKAFAARYYLARNDYTNALKYANEALAKHSSLVNYNTEMSFDPGIEPFDGGDVVYPITKQGQYTDDIQFQWKESFYYRYLTDPSWWLMPSQDLLSLYDQTYDLRYKYHIVEHYSFNRGMHPYSYPGYCFFFDKIPSGPTTAEMLLTKAECQARTGDWNDGLTTANQLRAVRMDNAAPANAINLSAGSQAEALAKILEERRREMPYTKRWFDLRRFNNNDDASDDVVLTKTFYPYTGSVILLGDSPVTYTLEKNSRRYASPLPALEIENTKGVLEQNIY